MAKLLVFFFLIATVVAVFSAPVEVDGSLHPEETPQNMAKLVRVRRVTCDVLGDPSLCALHCLAKGYRGGWCDERRVCNCR